MKTVVIVGITNPIALSLSKRYARSGLKLAIIEWATHAREADSVVEECLSIGASKAVAIKGDLSKDNDWKKIATNVSNQIGDAELVVYLDVCKNQKLFKDIQNVGEIKKEMENNFNSPIMAIHHFLPYLIKTTGQFILTGVAEETNALEFSTFQALNGMINTLQKEEKSVSFSLFYPSTSNVEENVELLVNSILQKKQKICLKEFGRAARRSGSQQFESDIAEPPPLKPETANLLCRAIFNCNRLEAKDIIKNSKNASLFEEKDEDGRTALHYSCYVGNFEIFNMLAMRVKAKKLFNEQDSLRFTPLHLAAFRGHIVICKKLTKYFNADPNLLSSNNMSALHYLARLDPTESDSYNPKIKNSYEKTMKALIDAGADANQRNQVWGTPVHEAARSGSLIAVTFLLRNEGDIFRKTITSNETPLHYAIRSGNRKVIEYLLDCGADPSAASATGTCFDIASPSICDLLETYREKNRRQESDTINTREIVVIDSLNDFPPDALKMISTSHLTQADVAPHWDLLLYILRFLTKRNYVKKGDPILAQYNAQLKKVTPTSKTTLNLSLQQATEQFITNGNPRKMFKVIEDAGRGGFGSVFKAKRVDDKKIVAIKKVPHLSEKEQWNNFDEIYFLQQMVNQNNVVKYYSSYFSRDEVWIVMDYMEGGTLSEVISRCRLDEIHICYVAKNVLKGLKEMHKLNLVHRDLKSANIMLSISGHVKIIDFGLCIDVSNTRPEHMVGSPFWIPPEMVRRQPHGPPADIWSLGIILIEMANGRAPNRSSSLRAMFEVGVGNVPKLDEDKWSKPFRTFVDRMLTVNQDERPSARELLEDPWIKKIDRNASNDMREVLRQIFLEKSLELSLGMA